MNVIASTAFGMDIDTHTTTEHPFVEHARRIMGIKRATTLMAKLRGLIMMISLCKSVILTCDIAGHVFRQWLKLFLSLAQIFEDISDVSIGFPSAVTMMVYCLLQGIFAVFV